MNVLNTPLNRWLAAPVLAGVLFGLIQFAPSRYGYTNPPVEVEPAWESESGRALVVRACYDCHSNDTVWTWYSYVAPVSWLITRDVNEGRAALNFQEWENFGEQYSTAEEAVELVTKDLMPPSYYLFLHPEARLNPIEEGELVQTLISVMESDPYLEAEDLNESENVGEEAAPKANQ